MQRDSGAVTASVTLHLKTPVDGSIRSSPNPVNAVATSACFSEQVRGKPRHLVPRGIALPLGYIQRPPCLVERLPQAVGSRNLHLPQEKIAGFSTV